MRARVTVFPFDLFGNAGTARGAELLGDALREMIADNRAETIPSRAHAYTDRVAFKEFAFEKLDDFSDWQKLAQRTVRPWLRKDDFVVWLSGNHLGVLPIYEEFASVGTAPTVLQFDAHLDAYNLADCTPELSHGNFLMHAERLPTIINVGHRDLFLPAEHLARYFHRAIAVERWGSEQPDLHAADRILIDIDCDVFDPAFFPAVGQALPFGLAPRELLRTLHALDWTRVCGVCLSEFDPARDRRDQSLGTLVWLLEWILLRRFETAAKI